MIDLFRNILSFIGTFLIVSASAMLLLQGIVCCITWNWSFKKDTDYKIIVTGIIIAVILIPFYYLPA